MTFTRREVQRLFESQGLQRKQLPDESSLGWMGLISSPFDVSLGRAQNMVTRTLT